MIYHSVSVVRSFSSLHCTERSEKSLGTRIDLYYTNAFVQQHIYVEVRSVFVPGVNLHATTSEIVFRRMGDYKRQIFLCRGPLVCRVIILISCLCGDSFSYVTNFSTIADRKNKSKHEDSRIYVYCSHNFSMDDQRGVINAGASVHGSRLLEDYWRDRRGT